MDVPGLTCVSPSVFPRSCGGMAIAQGTTFRVHKLTEYGVFGERATIEFDRGCAAPCDADETRCEANQTCLRRGFDICAWCNGTAKEICACRDQCANATSDDVQCKYDVSDDQMALGTCKAGRCCGEDSGACRDL